MNIPDVTGCSNLAEATRVIFLAQNGVHEIGNSNSGPEVDQYLAAVHLDPGNAWCCATAAWCIKQAAKQLNITPQIKLHASVYAFWHDPDNQSLIIPSFEPDCLVLRNEGVSKSGSHIGHLMLGIQDNGDNTFNCVSGNTTASDPNARTGGCVAIQNRPFSQLINGFGFMRIV